MSAKKKANVGIPILHFWTVSYGTVQKLSFTRLKFRKLILILLEVLSCSDSFDSLKNPKDYIIKCSLIKFFVYI